MWMFWHEHKWRRPCRGKKSWHPNQEWDVETQKGGDSSQENHHNLFFCLPQPWKRCYKYRTEVGNNLATEKSQENVVYGYTPVYGCWNKPSLIWGLCHKAWGPVSMPKPGSCHGSPHGRFKFAIISWWLQIDCVNIHPSRWVFNRCNHSTEPCTSGNQLFYLKQFKHEGFGFVLSLTDWVTNDSCSERINLTLNRRGVWRSFTIQVKVFQQYMKVDCKWKTMCFKTDQVYFIHIKRSYIASSLPLVWGWIWAPSSRN